MKRSKTRLVFISLLLWYTFFLCQKINLVTADLGRHLINGRVFWQTGQIIRTNFYSYTNPDFLVINHHWGSGVIFALVEKFFGFSGLSVLFILVSLISFALIYYLAQQHARPGWLLLTGLLLMPIIAERVEIRPEVFSYLFTGIFLLILNKKRGYWLLPILEILWVNLHIYFFLGPLIILIYWLFERSRKLFFLTIFTGSACLINPWGIQAALMPLTIWQNFGYRLVENQTVWFLERLQVINPNFLAFKLLLGLYLFSCLRFIWGADTVLAWLGIILAIMALRNFTLFGLLLFGPLAAQLSRLLKNPNWLGSGLIAVIVFLSMNYSSRLGLLAQNFGLGLAVGVTQAGEWVKTHVSGPIFNNYDSGGYLIYNLFPQRIFVDNRPEAYPKAFFDKIYIPLQENEAIWQAKLKEYGFQAIVFAYHDYTPWAQDFLQRRIVDPAWTIGYADQQVIVFVKKSL